jgi:hypothetical protein
MKDAVIDRHQNTKEGVEAARVIARDRGWRTLDAKT